MGKAALLFFLLLFGAATHGVHRFLAAAPQPSAGWESRLWMPRPEVLKAMALGHRNLVADMFWLETIQYYGGRLGKSKTMPDLYPLFDAVTTLDTKFVDAYIFASFVLADLRGAKQSEKILLKGLAHNPGKWEIPYQLGFVHYLYFKDNLKAAVYFEKASLLPNSPKHTSRLAAQLYKKGDSLENCLTARKLWSEAYQRAQDKETRQRTEKHIVEMGMLCDLKLLRQLLARYQTRFKGYPADLGQFTQLGWVPTLPVDPWGRPYIYQSQKAQVLAQAPKWHPWVELKSADVIP